VILAYVAIHSAVVSKYWKSIFHRFANRWRAILEGQVRSF